jgi:HSP20 family protein
VSQRGNELVIRADLPGLNADDVIVDVADDAVTIRGERREEHEEEHDGFFRSERAYGSFYRVIPLPEGAIAETAKATFNNGVLEIVVQAPPRDVSRGRRLEIEGVSSNRQQGSGQTRQQASGQQQASAPQPTTAQQQGSGPRI